jgi:hypothetical protein
MQCPCERAFRVKDELAGKKIRCPACKQVLVVPVPELVPEPADDDEAASYLMAEEPAPKRAAKVRDEDDERITAKPPPREKPKPRPIEDDRPVRKRRERVYYREEREQSRFSGLVISPSIVSGVLMMIGAVVWFIAGLALVDRIYFYPPILFVLGIGAVWRGATGQEE